MESATSWISLALNVITVIVIPFASAWARSIKRDMEDGQNAIDSKLDKLELTLQGKLRLIQERQIESKKERSILAKKLASHSAKLGSHDVSYAKLLERVKALRPSNPEMDHTNGG